MHPNSTCYVSGNDLVSVTQVRRLLLPLYIHEAQTTLSIANIKFTTSTCQVAKNLYSSCGVDSSLVRVRFYLSANFPQREIKQSFARPRLAALGLSASLSISTPSPAMKVVK